MITMIIPLVVAVLYYWMIFFLWMNVICCTLKHLWSSLFLRKTIQMKQPPHLTLAICILSQTSRHDSLLPRTPPSPPFFPPWISQGWLDNLNMIFMRTYFTFREALLFSPAVYGLCTLSICSLLVYFSLYHLNQWLFALPTGCSL